MMETLGVRSDGVLTMMADVCALCACMIPTPLLRSN